MNNRISTWYILGLSVVAVIWNQAAAADGVELFVPPDLGTIQFGDPLFVPVTIVNNTDQAVIVPDLIDRRPQCKFEISIDDPESTLFSSKGDGALYPRTRSLPARSVSRVVFALNVWHPREAHRMGGGSTSTVTVSSYRLLDETDRDGPAAVSDARKFRVEGSSVKDEAFYLNAAKEMVAAAAVKDAKPLEYAYDDSVYLTHFYDVFAFGHTWLTGWPSWKTELRDRWYVSYGGERLSQQPEYLAIQQQVVEGTALFRAMRCAEIREFIEFGEEPLEERLAKGLKDFREILSEARPAEYEFHVLSLRHVPANAMPDARAKYREAFREAFPEILAGRTNEGFLPVVPLRY